ncbi:hypothetical protein BDW59DRAFT_165549 [Aspergillus cavernicola]|uniref:Uncharacterized protein n=1 Tax=Aspergillus cavernicola TaxID=176166 RepID=A0ABR4HU50_9EURO
MASKASGARKDGARSTRLGGPRSDLTLGQDVEFAFQHHARYLHNGNDDKKSTAITFFDNAIYGSQSDKKAQIYPYSRGKFLQLGHRTHTFIPPGQLLIKSQVSLQTVPNGNVFINWGSEGAVTEFTPDGEPIYHAYLDSRPLNHGDVQNYRAFRANWTGFSEQRNTLVDARMPFNPNDNDEVSQTRAVTGRSPAFSFAAEDHPENGPLNKLMPPGLRRDRQSVK